MKPFIRLKGHLKLTDSHLPGLPLFTWLQDPSARKVGGFCPRCHTQQVAHNRGAPINNPFRGAHDLAPFARPNSLGPARS